jgi:tRNA (guanine-N7-)-methyltransferase
MTEHPERTRRMLYGRRKGPKLSAHQQSLLDQLLLEFELHLKSGVDPRAYFSVTIEDVWLEVGFGGGEHLIWQAQHHPKIGLIGAEPYVNGVVKLLSQIEALSLGIGGEGLGEGASTLAQNSTSPSPQPSPRHAWGRERIRVYVSDARDILEALPDASLGRVFVLFPDPWPKTRHHKRRFIRMETLDQLARVMKAGAKLRFASDDAGYVEWTLERLMAHPVFEWTAMRASDWHTRPPDWPPTRYEAKQLHGKPVFLNFCRR